MSVTLHLNPELEADLAAQARASGMTMQDYLLTLIERAAVTVSEASPPSEKERRAQAVRDMLEFGERHRLSLGEPVTRRLLHEGHRF